MNVLLTGATGFLGKSVKHLFDKQPSVKTYIASRNKDLVRDQPSSSIYIDLAIPSDSWSESLKGIDVIVHAAALAHSNAQVASKSEIDKINIEGTIALARQAVLAGVKRFVFISSIGVNGHNSKAPFRFDDEPQPHDNYTISKLEAERQLMEVAASSELEIVIIRPPLIYGKEAPGNFSVLVRFARLPLVLPFGAIDNLRSFIYVDNLSDFIFLCTYHPRAKNGVFLVSDGDDVSTSVFIKIIKKESRGRSVLLPVPHKLLSRIFSVMRKKAVFDKVCGNLQIDLSPTTALLGWEAPVSLREGIRRTFN